MKFPLTIAKWSFRGAPLNKGPAAPQHRWSLSNCAPKLMRRSSSADALAASHAAARRATVSGAAERMLDNFARRERERRASFSEIQSWEGLQVCWRRAHAQGLRAPQRIGPHRSRAKSPSFAPSCSVANMASAGFGRPAWSCFQPAQVLVKVL